MAKLFPLLLLPCSRYTISTILEHRDGEKMITFGPAHCCKIRNFLFWSAFCFVQQITLSTVNFIINKALVLRRPSLSTNSKLINFSLKKLLINSILFTGPYSFRESLQLGFHPHRFIEITTPSFLIQCFL